MTADIDRLIQPAAETPYLVMDLNAVEKAYESFTAALLPTRVHYAMKCNPHERVLRCLHGVGCGFEIASYAELNDLLAIGVDPADVLFSNPVKIPEHIQACASSGLWRFAFDGVDELEKLAQYAPGSAVYVRIATDSGGSEVPSEGKFGVSTEEATDLLLMAKKLGLRPYGITFHVGSQMTRLDAWDNPIRRSAAIMRKLRSHGIQLSMLDIGGGFPASYTQGVPDITYFGEAIVSALEEHLPYEVDVVAEPGRFLVADTGVMVTKVIGVTSRFGRRWIHLDIGAFNGMMECLETRNQLFFPIRSAKSETEFEICTVTGPSCDSQDTLLYDVPLPRGLATGDYLFVYAAGAYTTSYASRFNGFDVPDTYTLER